MTPISLKPRRLPGTWLAAIARVLFHEAVLEQVVRPTITDLQNEWIDAGEDRRQQRMARLRGYVAFWSLVFKAPVVFGNWAKPSDAGEGFFQRVWRLEMTMRTRILFTALLVAVGLSVGYASSFRGPVLYESTAVIQVVPPRVTTPLMDPANLPHTAPIEERLSAINQMILSRTRLEGLIREYGLFKHERENLIMQEVVELMRRRVVVRPSDRESRVFTVSFADPDPGDAMNVTAKLATFFIDESLKDTERRAENTLSFLESQTEEARRALEEAAHAGRGVVSVAKRTELEVLQTTYKSFLIKRADAYTLVNLERRQIGEQFNLLDPARLPTSPIGPTRLELTLSGGAAGLAAAVLFMLAGFVWRLGRDRRDVFSPTTA